MEERGTKTIMSGVLFLDIVEYSKKSVAGQISLKERFNSYLSDAIRDVPVPDRIILDTGDGAAINFLGDIEDALKAALSLRESILDEDHNIDPPLRVRAGINLGPVRLVRDINGQPNIVGDGINVAQRVMGFAEVNQILVSRSYYDAVSRLSPQYAGMFHFQGSRTDKHVREHEIYAVGHVGEKSTELAAANMLEEKEAESAAPISAPVKAVWESTASWLDSAIESIMVRFKLAISQQRALYIGVVAIAVVLIGVLLLKPSHNDKMPALPDIGPSGIQPVSAVASAAHDAPHAEMRGAGGAGIVPPVVTVKLGTKKGAEPKPDGKTAGGQFKHPKPKAAESARKGAAPAGMDSAVGQTNEAYISITCKEGTQLFVDGAEKGKIISTGLTVAVSPGKHKVIMTSKSGSLYTQNVELEPGKIAYINPGFCD
jgi:hypothetical protein